MNDEDLLVFARDIAVDTKAFVHTAIGKTITPLLERISALERATGRAPDDDGDTIAAVLQTALRQSSERS